MEQVCTAVAVVPCSSDSFALRFKALFEGLKDGSLVNLILCELLA